ncbi:phage protein NinX family protein [Paraburkholderia sp. A3RO-2L]|uniref:phage protein NinX family protein n=1 Tax=unclassified Paraburkholderia TaxID=2615204 RepID=UPI003DA7BE38
MTTKLNAAELTGRALDWAVARCLGEQFDEKETFDGIGNAYPATRYSSDWDQGGPLVERCMREGLLVQAVDPQYETLPAFKATFDGWQSVYRADSMLVAVCRCFVGRKLGSEIEVPQMVLDMLT